MISTLIYVSQSCIGQDGQALVAEMENIRTRASIKNAARGISGFLFFFDNRFVQILEGDFDAVTSLMSSIRRDHRHTNVRIVWFGEIEQRAFETWSMSSSMAFIERDHSELSVKLRFINRFVSDTSQQPIMLRDLLVSIALEIQKKKEFPRPVLVA